ncbi:hypothetical protein M8J75_009460 [Diaphorina citri]|nr:hypothetical protein M8J75_009460 [Diaphorina citri]
MATSYRPISLLSILGKILEKIIINRLLKTNIKLIQDEQFGFRTTCHQLVRILDYVTQNFARSIPVTMILLDIEKAFDCVWPDGILYKMYQLNINPIIVKTIESYLSNRTFQVSYGGRLSSKHNIAAGVPQGSILGPFLFSIFLSDLPTTPGINTVLFADDTALYAAGTRGVGTLIQNHLDKLERYYRTWKIKINASKTEGITFACQETKLKPAGKTEILFQGQPIEWKKEVKYLGCYLDSRLTWRKHIQYATGKARTAIGLLYNLICKKSTLDQNLKLLLYKVMSLIIRYFSHRENKVVTTFYRLLEIEAGDHLTMVTAFQSALEKDGLKIDKLLGIGIDGANVMTGKYNSFSSKLKELIPHLGTAQLHRQANIPYIQDLQNSSPSVQVTFRKCGPSKQTLNVTWATQRYQNQNGNTQRKSRRSPTNINTNRNTRSNSKAISNADSRNNEPNNGSRFSPLSNLSEERHSPVRQKITPIIVKKNGDNLLNMNKMLTELCKSKFTLKHLGDAVSIRTSTITDYELIKRNLKDNNKMFHTFTPTDRRDTKAVMKGLSPDWDAKDIHEEIGKNIEVESVTKMTTKNMGIYPMYIIRFKGHIPMTRINQMGYIFNMRIYWEKYSPKNRVTQC